jgi:hypothetical protein
MKETDSYSLHVYTPCIYYYIPIRLFVDSTLTRWRDYGYHKYTPQLDCHYRACENKILLPVTSESSA